MLSPLTAWPLQAMFWLFWRLLDSYRKPDIALPVPWNAAKVRLHMSGFSDWGRIRVFDAIERSTGTAIGGHFEIQRGLTAYYHRMPESISTHNYPSPYGLAGRVIPLSEDSTRVVARFRLATVRSLGYSFLILVVALLLVVGSAAADLTQPTDVAAFARLFVLSLPLTLPLGALVVTLIGDLVAPDRQKADLISYLTGMFGEDGLRPA